MTTASKTAKKAPQKLQEASGVRIYCSCTDLRPTAALRPNPGNPNGHPEAQVDKLAKIIKAHGWRHPITISRRSGFVVSGHCRLLAAQKLGLAEVPVDEQDFASDAEEYAVLIADNVVQELAETDGLKMAELLCELDQANYDLELTALSKEQIEDYINGPTSVPDGEGGNGGELTKCPKCGYEW
jgi:ParB-like chromosome segregation protein Spo0J